MADKQQTTDVKQFVALSPESVIPFKNGASHAYLRVINNSPTKNIVFKIRTT